MTTATKDINDTSILAICQRRTHRGGVFSLAPHAHDKHQIIIPHEGVAHLTIKDKGDYFVSRGQGVFISADCEHHGKFSGVLTLENLYLNTRSLKTNSRPFVFNVSELFLTLFAQLCSKSPWIVHDEEFAALIFLLNKEMHAAATNESFLPMPKSIALRALAQRLEANPAAYSSLETIAQELAISPRHVRRLFRKECGLSITRWMARLKIMTAQEMLAANESISTIALELGFEEFASFSRFFKKETGRSPREWMHDRHVAKRAG